MCVEGEVEEEEEEAVMEEGEDATGGAWGVTALKNECKAHAGQTVQFISQIVSKSESEHRKAAPQVLKNIVESSKIERTWI